MQTKNLKDIASETIQFTNEKITSSTTSLAYNDLPPEEQKIVGEKLKASRRGRSYVQQANVKSYFDRLDADYNLFKFYNSVDGAIAEKTGNCGELASLGLYYIAMNYPDVPAEMFHIEGGDHAFLILGRPINSNIKDPLSWTNAIVCDPFEKTFYPIEDYLSKMKNFVVTQVGDKQINVEEEFDIERHKLNKIESNDSAYINSFNTNEKIEEMKTFLKVKLILINQLLKLLFIEIKDNVAGQDSVLINNKLLQLKFLFLKTQSPDTFINGLLNDLENPSYRMVRELLNDHLQNEVVLKFRDLLLPIISQDLAISPKLGFLDRQENIEVLKKFDIESQHINAIFNDIIDCEKDIAVAAKLIQDSSIDAVSEIMQEMGTTMVKISPSKIL
jgi:hypothetical protein